MDQYLVPAAVVAAYFGWRWLHNLRTRRTAARLLTEGATVIDVRSAAEFARGHGADSLNVPLADLGTVQLIVSPDRWLIACCASGTRSAIARGILRRRGFARVINGGSWVNVDRARAG
jgi:phage shock protein E